MPPLETTNGKKYWRSLDELSGTPEFREFMAREFPAGATEMLDAPSRRSFLKIMSASLALAGLGLTGCRWPQEKILPYSYRPDGVIDGQPKYYATAMELGGVATGLLVLSSDGRPTKVEGNPSHPYSLGSSNTQQLASLLEMYDPDRSKLPINRERGQHNVSDAPSFVSFASSHFGSLKQRRGAGLAVLSEGSDSPSIVEMRARFQKAFPEAVWYEWEPVNDDNERRGTLSAFGQPLRSHYAFDQADVIVAFDCDFLDGHPAMLRHSRDWAKRRVPNGKPMSRHYHVESTLSTTGAQADHRLAVKPTHIPEVLFALIAEMSGGGISLPGEVGEAMKDAKLPEGGDKFVRAMAKDLLASRGAGLICVGSHQPAEVHALVHLLNSALGNLGRTVTLTAASFTDRPTRLADISDLSQALHRKDVSTLLIIGGNPVYTAPTDLDFAGGLKQVGTSIHLSLYDDETSHACTWHLPRTHYMESWGDARAWDGTVSIVQPLIAPLFSSWTPIELLSLISEETPWSAYEIVRRTLKPGLSAGDFETNWELALNKGLIDGSAWPEARPFMVLGPQAADIMRLRQPTGEGLIEVHVRPDYKVFDGRFSNSGWLQELPDPISKITWDNPLYVGVGTAASLGISHGQMVNVDVDGRELEVPAQIIPGMPDGAAALALGYGRERAGRVGDKVGVNAYALRSTDAMNLLRAKVTPLARKYKLATTQDHFAIDVLGIEERGKRVKDNVREMTVAEYAAGHPAVEPEPMLGTIADPDGVHRPLQLWVEPLNYSGHKWGMAIDLNLCTGCSACVTACQSENNIPVVGRKRVLRNREMHWIRVDRYFQGHPENPTVATQPVTCHHCENAPCEQVCPVAATTHSDEGLNQMVYNRCIGTRYCSNNCPYKVRRFNFFAYNRKITEIAKMAMNPEVTVRSRGVMEKCSFCVQRIQNVKIRAKNDNRSIADGEITPACAQACPSQAIIFGDLNDPGSRISKQFNDKRSYAMLAELNTRPRLNYLARLRNPSPELSS